MAVVNTISINERSPTEIPASNQVECSPQLNLHSLLVSIQSSDSRVVLSHISSLVSHLSSHEHLHAYIHQSPQLHEIFALVSNNTSPLLASGGFHLLATVLKQTACPSCNEVVVRHATNAITGTGVFDRIQNHLASDDKRIQSKSLALALALIRHQQGLRLLRRLNWKLRIWKQHPQYVSDFLIEALNLHTRFMLVTEGPAASLRYLVSCLPKLRLPDVKLERLFTPLIHNLRLLSPVMTQPCLVSVAALHSAAESGSRSSNIVQALIVALLSARPPSHVTLRAALCLNPFTSLQQRRLVLDWIADRNRCSLSCLQQYLSALQCSLTPRLSFRYVCNVSFLEQVVQHLPSSSSMPACVSKSALSAALQQKSRLVVTLAQQFIIAVAKNGSKQALKLVPDTQVVLRSSSGPDDDVFLCCVRALMHCGALPRDYAWTLVENQITTGNVLCDMIRTDILQMAPLNITPPVEAFNRAALTETDPLIYARLVAIMRHHRISLTLPSKISQKPVFKKAKRDSIEKTVVNRFRALRLCSQGDRHDFIRRVADDSGSSDDDLFVAFILTTDSDCASKWNSCTVSSSCLFRQWLIALVMRRHGHLDSKACSTFSWSLRMVCASALCIADRLRFSMLSDCPVSVVTRLIPHDPRPTFLALSTIVEYVSVMDLDQDCVLLLCRRAILTKNGQLLLFMKQLAQASPARFSVAFQALRSETIPLPDWAQAISTSVSHSQPDALWYNDVWQLKETAMSWLCSSQNPPSIDQISDLLRAYGGSTSELDLMRFDCIEAAGCTLLGLPPNLNADVLSDRLLENSLIGTKFGPSLESFDVLESPSLDEWLKCLPNLKFQSRWFELDPRFIIPSALAILDKANTHVPPSLIESGLVSFTIARGFSSELGSVRACAYTLLSRVYHAADLITAQAHQVLTLIKNSVYTRIDDDVIFGDAAENEGLDSDTESESHQDESIADFPCIRVPESVVSSGIPGFNVDQELPVIPHLSAVLWASMFFVMVSRQGPSHPMYAVVCAYMARRAWIPMPLIPDSLRFDEVSFPNPSRLQWLLQVLAIGLRTRRDADSFQRMKIWSRLQAWRPLLKFTKLFWAVFAAGAKIERSREQLVYEHAIIPFVHHYLNDDGALDFLFDLVSNMDPVPVAVRGQITMALRDVLLHRHTLALPVAAKMASIAAPMEFPPVLRPEQLNLLLCSYDGDLDTVNLVDLLSYCFIDVSDSDQGCAQQVVIRLLNSTESAALVNCLMAIIQKFIKPDPFAVSLYDVVIRHQYHHLEADEVAISAALGHLRRKSEADFNAKIQTHH